MTEPTKKQTRRSFPLGLLVSLADKKVSELPTPAVAAAEP